LIVLTLANTVRATHLWYTDAFVVGMRFSYTTASYWSSVLGAPAVTVSESPIILDVLINYIQYYIADSYATCLATESSWYFDGTTLWIHMDHLLVPDGVVIQYGKGVGYSDSSVVYIGSTQYLPLVTDTPSIERSEDIKEYGRLKLLATDIKLTNMFGVLDSLQDENIIGNSAMLSYIQNEKIVDGFVSAGDAVPQAFYYVEKVEHGQQSVSLALQDIRKLNKQVPTRVFDATTYPYLNDSDDGAFVPLIYGRVRAAKCFPVTANQTGTTDATFRCAEFLTTIHAVRVKIGDTWTAATVTGTDLANGTFTISGGRSAAGKDPYACQADVTGIPVVYASDIIVDLYSRYLGQAFTDQFYNLTEWNANKVTLPTCGLIINEQKDILDIIPIIQNGIYPSFRFDITYDGLKTIRIDDKTRGIDWFVGNLDIINNDKLTVVESSEYLFGEVTVQYDKDYTDGTYRPKTVNTYVNEIKENYQWSNTNTIPSLLNDATLANNMAVAKSVEYRYPIRTIELDLFGDKYFGVEIYDIMQADTALGRAEYYSGDFTGREFFGVIVGQVLRYKPNYDKKTVTVTLRILDRVPFEQRTLLFRMDSGGEVGLGTEDDTYYVETEDGLNTIACDIILDDVLILGTENGNILAGD
jgi:hypothetical protein